MTPRLLAPHEVTVAGVTARPDAAWVTQQARNAAMDLNDRQVATRFVLRDHDAKFTGAFDEIFRTEGAEVIRTPIRAPRANAYAERWVQTVRGECLDWTLVLGRRHLLRLLRVYVRHYNEQRPHRGLALRVPLPGEQRSTDGRAYVVRRRDVLGGLIHEYQAVAAWCIKISAPHRRSAASKWTKLKAWVKMPRCRSQRCR